MATCMRKLELDVGDDAALVRPAHGPLRLQLPNPCGVRPKGIAPGYCEHVFPLPCFVCVRLIHMP